MRVASFTRPLPDKVCETAVIDTLALFATSRIVTRLLAKGDGFLALGTMGKPNK
jgi:hypothetical protein